MQDEVQGDELLEARRGNRRAYRALIERFRAPVVAVGLAQLLGRDAALSVAEEALAGLRAHIAAARDIADLGARLIESALDAAGRLAAPARPRARLAELAASSRLALEAGKGLVVRCDLALALEALLSEVPPGARLPLALRTYAGLPYGDIASLCRLERAEVAQRLSTAIETLERALAERAPGGPDGA